MNTDTGKISPQFHVIFDDEFQTVVSDNSSVLLSEQWRNILHLGRECFAKVDYDNSGNAILPPLTSVFQQDDVVTEIALTSPWHLNDDRFPRAVPSSDHQVAQPVNDFVPEGVAPNTFECNNDSEGEPPHPVSVPEGVSHDNPMQPDHSLVIEPPGMIDESGLSATGRPCQNVGNYKQGPAKIRRLLVEGEQYDFSFLVISEWEQPRSVSKNRSNNQANFYPTQRVNKSFLAECYLLQYTWFDNPSCPQHIYSNVILDS
jgi:hypothetical protein